jgi:hypothetical protein
MCSRDIPRFPEFRKRDRETAWKRIAIDTASLCRLLGNPVAFAVVQLLAENKESSPSEIARAIGESVQRVRGVLSALCLANEAGDAHLPGIWNG